MTPTPDVIVVGAGIVGAACAYELAQAGVRVEVVDQGIPGGGATAAGMGHLVALDGSEAELSLSRLSLELWHSLAKELPRSSEFTTCGTLWIAADQVELDGVKDKPGVELLDEKQLYEAEPHLRPGLAGGAVAARDAAVYAPCATRWLLDHDGIKVTLSKVSNLADLRAGTVVCATGAFTPQLLPDLPIRPRKGHLAITDRYPGLARHQLVELGYLQSAHGESNESVAFNVQPRPTGQLLIGSSRQYGVDSSDIEPAILGRMLNRAFAYLPKLKDCTVIRTWTGYRASTPDKLPLIGKINERILLATGHEGLGVTTSLGTAKLVAAEILGQPPPIPAKPYRPERFHA